MRRPPGRYRHAVIRVRRHATWPSVAGRAALLRVLCSYYVYASPAVTWP